MTHNIRQAVASLDSLWVFLEENGVEPTNNRAERALRFGVIWRKRSNGTQSGKGIFILYLGLILAMTRDRPHLGLLH